MARTVTLSNLRTDIATQADITGAIGSSARYTTTQLNRWINQEIQNFREALSNEGAQHFLTHATGTVTSGATSPHAYKELDLSAISPSVVRIYMVTITVNGRTKRLTHVPFQEHTEFGGPTNTSEPIAWANINTAKIAILPPPSGSYTYVVYYLPVLTDLSADGDTFDGIAGWEEFIVWAVVVRTIVRDQYPQAYQMALNERDRRWADILRNATRVTSAGGATVGRDSMGESLRRGRGRMPPPWN